MLLILIKLYGLILFIMNLDLELEDIAEKLEISLSSVMDRIHRARNKLRNYLTIQ